MSDQEIRERILEQSRQNLLAERDVLRERLEAAQSRVARLEAALRNIKQDCEICAWHCERGHEFAMTDTDLYHYATEALGKVEGE